MTLFKAPILAAMFASGALALAADPAPAFAQAESAEESDDAMSNPLVIEMKRGEVIQIIAPEARADGNEARQAYYKTAFPIAEKLGYKKEGQLAVRQKVVSDYDPGGLLFYSWPNAAAAKAFANHPGWPALKAERPKAWNELKIYTSELDEDLRLTFDPAKFYTVVIAWGNPENPDDYERYLSGIEPAVKRSGGRFIYKMRNPEFEAHASSPEAPVQLTFVEWDDPAGFAAVQSSEEYLASRQYFSTGLTRFEFYWLEHRP